MGGDQPAIAWVEHLRSVFGEFIGLMLVIAMAKFLGELSVLNEWLMASLSARLASICFAPEPNDSDLSLNCGARACCV